MLKSEVNHFKICFGCTYMICQWNSLILYYKANITKYLKIWMALTFQATKVLNFCSNLSTQSHRARSNVSLATGVKLTYLILLLSEWCCTDDMFMYLLHVVLQTYVVYSICSFSYSLIYTLASYIIEDGSIWDIHPLFWMSSSPINTYYQTTIL